MNDITFYSTFEEMMEDLQKRMKEADARVKPTQASIKAGQYFINFRHGPELPIFGEVLDPNEPLYEEPHMKHYRLTKAYSAACEWGEMGDTHVSDMHAIIDKELFQYYKEHNWRPPSREEKIQKRVNQLLSELKPLFQHSDILVTPSHYNQALDTLCLEVIPRSPISWAKTAYKFASQEDMKYDRDSQVYGIDGQPRVSYSGQVWARYVSSFVDSSKVAFHIWSQQPSHAEAEEQLAKLYGIFKERDGLEPMEVFRTYF